MAISDELRKLVDPNNECCCEHCLSNKCKEWAFEFRFDNKPTNNRYYRQRSGYEDKFNVEKQKREKLGYMTLTFGCLGHTKTFYADTEPEAIFKACEWILTKDSK